MSETTGTISRLLKEKSFGFIRDAGGREYFFHRTGCVIPELFDRLQEGQTVIFEASTTHKGPRAQDVRRAAGMDDHVADDIPF